MRRWWCALLAGVLLLTQWSVAAHACPAMAAVAATAEDGAATGPMDMPDPGLCIAHCQHGQQSADHAPAPAVPPAPPSAFSDVVPALPCEPMCASIDPPRPQAATSPPLAVLHCCFRI